MVAGSGGAVHQASAVPAGDAFYPPTLITGLSPADPLMQDEIFGPVLVSTTFRTPAEAVQVANATRYGLAATLWSEDINRALDIAPRLAAGVVWVNATNLFDAAAGFGGVRESGFGREGGWEGLRAYTRPATDPVPLSPAAAIPAPATPKSGGLDRTAKMYIGGKQARPDSGYSRPVWSPDGRLLGHAPEGSRKDIRNAVEAATGAAGWGRTTGHLRAQILYYVAENLSARVAEFATRITDMTGARTPKAEAEVAASIDRLFTFAAWADKYDGAVKPVPIRGVALAMPEPVGVIGAFAPDEAPLLGAVSILGAALAMGNRLVLVPSDPFPLAATDLYQVLDTSDVPAGVVNIVTGGHASLAKPLASHLGVDAVWSFSGTDISATLETEAAGNLKRTWVNHGHARDWNRADARAFLAEATETKTIWVPYGA
jgi:aldehyde dehydrogenase (NAD+)